MSDHTSYEHLKLQYRHLERQHMAFLESVASAKAMQPHTIVIEGPFADLTAERDALRAELAALKAQELAARSGEQSYIQAAVADIEAACVEYVEAFRAARGPLNVGALSRCLVAEQSLIKIVGAKPYAAPAPTAQPVDRTPDLHSRPVDKAAEMPTAQPVQAAPTETGPRGSAATLKGNCNDDKSDSGRARRLAGESDSGSTEPGRDESRRVGIDSAAEHETGLLRALAPGVAHQRDADAGVISKGMGGLVQAAPAGIADLRDAKWLDPECAHKGACQSLLFKAAPVSAEDAHFVRDLRDFLLHVIDMGKGDQYWDVVRENAEALLLRAALAAKGEKT